MQNKISISIAVIIKCVVYIASAIVIIRTLACRRMTAFTPSAVITGAYTSGYKDLSLPTCLAAGSLETAFRLSILGVLVVARFAEMSRCILFVYNISTCILNHAY